MPRRRLGGKTPQVGLHDDHNPMLQSPKNRMRRPHEAVTDAQTSDTAASIVRNIVSALEPSWKKKTSCPLPARRDETLPCV